MGPSIGGCSGMLVTAQWLYLELGTATLSYTRMRRDAVAAADPPGRRPDVLRGSQPALSSDLSRFIA
jgi:hypothetical protein